MTNLPEILHNFAVKLHPYATGKGQATDYDKYKTETQAAIAELVDKCIGPDEPVADIKWQLKNPTKDPYERNKLKAEIRNNLKAEGII